MRLQILLLKYRSQKWNIIKNLSIFWNNDVKGKGNNAILIQAYGDIILEMGGGGNKKWEYRKQEQIKSQWWRKSILQARQTSLF